MRAFQFSISFILFLFLTYPSISQRSANDLYDLAYDEYQNNDFEECISILNELLVKSSRSDAYLLKASAQEELDDDYGAVETYTSLLQLNPMMSEALFKRGELYLKLRYYSLAVSDFSDLLEFDNANFTQAIFFKIDPTGEEQVQVGSIETMRSTIYTLRSEGFKQMGEFEKALNDINNAIKLDSSANNYLNRALVEKEQGNERKAMEDIRYAITIEPDNSLLWYNLLLMDPLADVPVNIINEHDFKPLISYEALEAYQKGEFKKAESLFRISIKADPVDPLVLVNFGRLKNKLGKYEEARKLYFKALDLDPGQIECYYLIANTFFKDKAYENASIYYEQFLGRDPARGDIWYNAAITYYLLKQYSDACRCLENALARGASVDRKSGLWRRCQ